MTLGLIELHSISLDTKVLCCLVSLCFRPPGDRLTFFKEENRWTRA
jgi:hypothetical protein